MSPVAVVIGLWVAFIATHMVPSDTKVRPRLVEALGERTFLGLYSVLSFAFFVPLVWYYFTHKHAGPLLWTVALSPAVRWALYLAMGVAFVLMVAGVVNPSPVSLGQRPSGEMEVHGVQRLTRHPLFMGLGLFGVLHLLVNGSATDVAFFAGFPIFAVLGCRHQDRRKLATLGAEFRAFVDRAPFFPFTGAETLRGLRELSPIALLLGIVITIALRTFHQRLFG
jgi:uncharacterized membrane protein